MLPLITNGLESNIISKPKELSKLVNYSKKIGKVLNTAMRIDYYIGTNGAILGEFTPHPSAGKNYTEFGRKLLNYHMKKERLNN